MQKRLAEAKDELKQIWDYKYALVNDVLDQAVAEMRAIVLCERGVRDGVRRLRRVAGRMRLRRGCRRRWRALAMVDT